MPSKKVVDSWKFPAGYEVDEENQVTKLHYYGAKYAGNILTNLPKEVKAMFSRACRILNYTDTMHVLKIFYECRRYRIIYM